MAEFRVIIN